MKYSLPESAKDLLIKDGKLLMKSLSIYEILRRFGHIIRLTPFRFEDFCAAILAEEQSPLLAEVHIQLLKTLIREDRQQQTWLGPPDIRDSINIYLHSVDQTNWPSALKIYLSADPTENSTILERLNENNYPFNVELTVKLEILDQLCDKFLLSNLAREEIVNGNTNIIKHDTSCRLCSKSNGDLVPCGDCTAVYHLKCSDPPLEDFPDYKKENETYQCAICRSNHIKGVSDCLDSDEKSGNLKRHEALGLDKLGRRYWFLVRRLFVVDNDEEDVRYYTSVKQLNEIIDNLNENRLEKSLIANLLDKKTEIERQMQITQGLYKTHMSYCKEENGIINPGQEGAHKSYINHYSSNLALSKNQHPDRDINRSLNNKFCINSLNSFKWSGVLNGQLNALTITIKTTILRLENQLPSTFIHPCWATHRSTWVKSINQSSNPEDIAIAMSLLESAIKPILFKSSWHDAIGFSQLFRSTLIEREEIKKNDRLQPRGFERREWFSQDFELSYRLGTAVKFSSKLKPVKHQVWKQKGEEYRLTGLNGWSWMSRSFKSRPQIFKPCKREPKIGSKSTNNRLPGVDKSNNHTDQADIKNEVNQLNISPPIVNLLAVVNKDKQPQQMIKRCVFAQPKLPPCHNFMTRRSKILSLLVLPDLELRKLARSGGLKEAKSFNYTAKQSSQVWPYGMTPRPTFRTCWLYRNRLINTIQDVSLQLKVLYASIRWDDLQVRPPASGHNIIATDESTITIELLKKRDHLPFLTHSEYLIRKVSTPIEQPTKYRKVGVKKVTTPSARSGLRARRQTVEEEVKGPTTEEVWVNEDQLELWELKQFDEKIERQKQLMRERLLREEAEKKRRLEEERRRKAEQERRQRLEEEARKTRTVQSMQPTTPQGPRPVNIGVSQPRSLPTTPVLRYFRTEQGQIIRLPASYLERGTPLILRHVGPGPNQTKTYLIRPQVTPTVASTTAPQMPINLPSSSQNLPETKGDSKQSLNDANDPSAGTVEDKLVTKVGSSSDPRQESTNEEKVDHELEDSSSEINQASLEEKQLPMENGRTSPGLKLTTPNDKQSPANDEQASSESKQSLPEIKQEQPETDKPPPVLTEQVPLETVSMETEQPALPEANQTPLEAELDSPIKEDQAPASGCLAAPAPEVKPELSTLEETGGSSVGTVENELAHDQRASVT